MNELDHLIRRIKGLVDVRERLRRAGASEQELARQTADIHRLQERLAERVRRSLQDGSGAGERA
jgi:hypothetical protein